MFKLDCALCVPPTYGTYLGVLAITFERPASVSYKAGQWCRIATPGISASEFHPFTISSAPHEDNLSVHVRVVGRWTRKLAAVYSVAAVESKTLPPLYMEGPYGDGAQVCWVWELGERGD